MHSYLNTYIRTRKIDGCVPHTAQEQDVELFYRFECSVEMDSLLL